MNQTSFASTRSETDIQPISPVLESNLKWLETHFEYCEDLSVFQWHFGPELQYTAFSVYFDSLFENKALNYMKASLQDLVPHEVGPAISITPEDVIRFFSNHGVSSQSSKLVNDLIEASDDIVTGHLVIFINGWNQALSYKVASLTTRQVSEPSAESVVHGPRESTVENLQKNIGMLRQRLKTPNFKLEKFTLGVETKTEVNIAYLINAVNLEALAELKERISRMKKVNVLDTSFIEEWIEDSTYSPFPQYRYTERPDTATAALLDGKIIVLVEGTGSILICPGLFTEMYQSSEDFYQRSMIASLIRIMRIFAFFIALSLPSIYIALTTFHPELIPTVLLLALMNAREGIPFPAFYEAAIMEFFFELLREAGARLPRQIGSTISIVGALVIGEAAISAGIASPSMVVVVSLTGIASFAIPQYNMATALRIIKIPLMILSTFLGGFGLMIGFLWILLHLTSLRSLGQPYLNPVAPLQPKQLLDTLIRAPLKILLRSPRNKLFGSKK
ncbi:spore germination protein [Paenibacillus algorifonticola]|uniref:Spore germination protein n=1 Tax=Paenibacillus algorifonticola TaxID=684063 RepID=A0A1I2FI41_9BACL|nr:spore germination protein [Paenibacillus algorifonticola]SFF04438.1 spore germination protein [Paenibacillus algorifonticola]